MVYNINKAKQEPEMYTPKDIQRIFKCSKNTAYAYIQMNGFPSIQINNCYYIPKAELEKWISRNLNRRLQC